MSDQAHAMRLRRLVTMEVAKSLKNRWFVIMCAIGCACALATAAIKVPAALRWIESWPRTYLNASQTGSMLSSYSNNLLTDYSSASKWLYFAVAPLLITLSYSWSLASERKSGYAQLIVAKVGRVPYYVAKYAAVFNSAGLTIALPLLFSFIVTSCFLPAYYPSTYDSMYLVVDSSCILGDLFYANPLAYMVLRILLDYLFAGLWAVGVLALSLLVRNRVALVAFPYLLLMGVKMVGERLYVMLGVHGPSITLLDQLKACPDAFYNWNWVTALEMALLFVAGVVAPAFLLRRDFM